MIRIVMEQIQFQVGDLAGAPGGKLLEFRDPQSGLTVTIPLDANAARLVGSQLSTGLIVASGPLPANGKVN